MHTSSCSRLQSTNGVAASFDDVPWDKLDTSLNSERKATRIKTYCAEEFYFPDYTAAAFSCRSDFRDSLVTGLLEIRESKHVLLLREYVTRSGIRSVSQFARFGSFGLFEQWKVPFATRRQMGCYGALQ
jgi:acyl-[acyl-carrier-protein] desaturase